MRQSRSRHRSSSAVVVYVVVLMALQVFVITVAAEAVLAEHAGLAWASAVVSVALFACATAFLRYLRP